MQFWNNPYGVIEETDGTDIPIVNSAHLQTDSTTTFTNSLKRTNELWAVRESATNSSFSERMDTPFYTYYCTESNQAGSHSDQPAYYVEENALTGQQTIYPLVNVGHTIPPPPLHMNLRHPRRVTTVDTAKNSPPPETANNSNSSQN